MHDSIIAEVGWNGGFDGMARATRALMEKKYGTESANTGSVIDHLGRLDGKYPTDDVIDAACRAFCYYLVSRSVS